VRRRTAALSALVAGDDAYTDARLRLPVRR